QVSLSRASLSQVTISLPKAPARYFAGEAGEIIGATAVVIDHHGMTASLASCSSKISVFPPARTMTTAPSGRRGQGAVERRRAAREADRDADISRAVCR